MKKIIALLLVSIFVLVACSKSEETVSTDTNGADAGGDTITIWVPPFGNTEETNEAFWQRMLKDVAEEVNAEIAVETVPWDNYEEKYMAGISGGSGPDIGYMYNEMLKSYVDMNLLAPIGDYFTQEEVDQYIYWDYGTINGKQLTLPFVVGAPRILFCNMDLINEAGFDAPPTTWADLEEMSLAINSMGKIGFMQYWGGYYGDLAEIFYPYLWQAGGDLFDEEGNLIVNSAEGIKAAEWIYSLKEKGILTDSATAMNAAAVSDLFLQGELAMFVSSSVSSKKFDAAGMNWSFAPYTVEVEGKQGGTFVASDALVMISTAKHKAATAKIMKEMTSPRVMEAFHQERYSMPPISVNEAYYDNAKFEQMYIDEASNFRALPIADNTVSIYQALYSNLQRMMMDEISAKEALDETVEYANSLN